MQLTEAIKQNINNRVDDMLMDLDLDAEVDRFLSPEAIKGQVQAGINQHIQNEVISKVRERIHAAIAKRVPLLDAVIESKVVAFMMGFTSYIDQLENDVNNNAEGKKQ